MILNTPQLRHPFYLCYLSNGGRPKKKHYDLAVAVAESHRLANEFDTPVFIIEFTDLPKTIGCVKPDGMMVEL